MSTQEIADRLVALCRQGQFEQPYRELYADNARGVEPKGANAPELVEGVDNLIQKSQEFSQSIEEVFGVEVSDPVVAENYFAVSLVMDASFKGMGRFKMEEICLYHVKDGKVVQEQFFYTPQMAEA